MTKSHQELMQENLEIFLNELQADMQIFQLVLQHFLANTLLALPNNKEILVDLQKQIQKKVEAAANVSADPQDGERMKQLTMARADRFFQPLNRIFEIPPENTPAGKWN